VGFRGQWTELKDAPLVAVYEARFPFCQVNGDVGSRESGGS
jgi:hypothetical protein